MPVEPTSSLAIERLRLADMLAACPQLLGRFGAPGATSALPDPREPRQPGKIHLGALTVDDHEGLRPYAVILRPGEAMYEKLAGGDHNYLQRRGTLWVYLADNSRYADPTDDLIDFENFAGGVIDDLAAIAGRGGLLPIHTISFHMVPERTDPKLDGQDVLPFWDCILELQWE
jgi:hypothetical protein